VTKGFPGGGDIGGVFVLQQVTLFDSPDYAGRSRALSLGQYRFFTPDDFNDSASSIRVPAGMVALLFEHADEGGGYGRWVDLLEDCPNLAVYDFDKVVSFVDVFSAVSPEGRVWARGIMDGGTFVPGHWVRQRASGELPPNPGVGVVGPPLPSRAPPPRTAIQVDGTTSVITTLGAQDANESFVWEHAVTDQFGVIGSDFRGAEEIGTAAFERASHSRWIPDWINFWYPQRPSDPRDHRGLFKQTLIGTVDDVHVANIPGTYQDFDLNILIAPDDRHRNLVTGAHPREYTDIMSLEWNGSGHEHGQPDCDDPESVREADLIEAEIQASSDLDGGVNELLRDIIAAAGDRKIGVYGAYIYDKGHCCHAEIHPAEQLWWREDLADRSVYHCAVVCDASGRFWWRDQMDDGTKLKPWGAPPVTGVFAIAFEVPPPSPVRPTPGLVFEVADVSSYNRVSASGGPSPSTLVHQGVTVVALVPNNDAFSVSFEQVGTGPNGSIRGFLVIAATVGKLTQKVVDAHFPAGTDVNAIDQDDERKVFSKEEGHYFFTVTQHAAQLVGGVLGTG
jgi:hypothetical protein